MTHVRARLVICCIAISLSLAVHDATAAELTLTPVVAEVLQPDLMPFPVGTTPDLYSLHGIPVTLKVDYFVEISNLNEGQLGFGNVVFNVDLFRLQQNALVPDWQPDVSFVDVNGPALGGVVPTWDDNTDIGMSQSDLRYVFAGLFPRDFRDPAVDPRYRIGQDGPAYLGSTYIDWDGAQPAMLRPQHQIDQHAFSTFNEEKWLVADPSRVQYGEIQLGMPAEHQNMRVLDWEMHGWSDPSDLSQVFHVKNMTVTASLSGDTYFDQRHGHGPHIDRDFEQIKQLDTLNFLMNFEESRQAMTVLLEFSRQVIDVEFSLLDIDFGPSSKERPGFVDQVTIVGFLGETAVLPNISSGSLNEVNGNVITGTAIQQASTSYNLIHFDQPIDRISLVYGNGANAPNDPGLQGIGVTDLHFTINNPEPGSIALAIVGCGVLAGRRYWKSRAART